MWVFCCGMHRAGSTLQYQLAGEIVESRGLGNRLGYVDGHNFPTLYANHKDKKSLLIVKCHDYFDEVARLHEEGNAKLIYVHRDIRDVVVSMMNVDNRSFSQTMRHGYVELALKMYHLWTGVGDILVSRYEDMIKNSRQETAKIASYLGVNIDENIAGQIAEKYSVQNQMIRIQGIDYESVYENASRRTAPDPFTMLKKNHIHAPNPGQWKIELSWLQIAFIEYLAYDWMIERGYSISQPWIYRKVAVIRYLRTSLPGILQKIIS